MNHLYIMTRSRRPNPVTTRFSKCLSSSGLKDGFYVSPGSFASSWHEGWTIASALLSARNPRANKQKALGFQFFGATIRIGVMGVSTINNDVPLFEVRDQLLDEIVDSVAGFNEKNDFTWCFQFLAKLLD
jgi:hypothetical protein